MTLLPPANKVLTESKSVPIMHASNNQIPKMRKMTEEHQGCFMLVAETCHPNLRLSFPNSTKILAGTVAWLVNKLCAAPDMETGMKEIFGTTEMMDHAVNNVTSVHMAKKYPGNMFNLLEYIPISDKIWQWQITVCVEYLITELLALAGAVTVKLEDQEQFKSTARVNYEDYPLIRPSDIKTAVQNDEDLKHALGGLFKL
ncbi:hypothetical protein ScalyP_jg9002 [Parmales sp. scaly parma]|nr:hypothetical protein ScalyP_jg9002 [Parmales sp. scaly parma]